MTTLTPALRKNYEDKWRTCEVDYEKDVVMSVTKRVLAVKETCSGFWNVPWWFIALCWLRECNLNPNGSLAQGDPWNQVSRHEPKGRGPFSSWREAAIDALRLEGYDKKTDWSVSAILFMLEGFNGYGYLNKGVPSPYLWSHTNHYADGSWDDDPRGGKYIADHVWSADVYDKQIGCCAVLKYLTQLDSSIKFGEQVTSVPPSTVHRGIVIPQGLNLRAGANTSSEILEVLRKDTVVEVLENGASWLHVNVLSGKSGWVSARYIRIDP